MLAALRVLMPGTVTYRVLRAYSLAEDCEKVRVSSRLGEREYCYDIPACKGKALRKAMHAAMSAIRLAARQDEDTLAVSRHIESNSLD